MDATILIIALFMMVCATIMVAASLCLLGSVIKTTDRVRRIVSHLDGEDKRGKSFVDQVRNN
jgi:hypothetical protein